jgi:hypothetical protein
MGTDLSTKQVGRFSGHCRYFEEGTKMKNRKLKLPDCQNFAYPDVGVACTGYMQLLKKYNEALHQIELLEGRIDEQRPQKSPTGEAGL